MTAPPSLDEWLQAMAASAQELATSMLDLEGASLVRILDTIPQSEQAAYISLVGDHNAVQLGLGASPQGCQALAKALMGMAEDEPDLDQDEMVDAFGEITNILAGQVKTLMASKTNGNLNLGTPLFIKGQMYMPDGFEVRMAEATIGAHPVTLLVMRSPPK